MDAERFLLKWNNHQSNLVTVFDQLYEQEAFTDVTLACDGRSFAAHKVILSACSPYFQQLFLSNPCKHPIIFMRDVRASDLDALLAFMYRGEINVHQQDLASFLKTAESLQIKGLSDSSDKPRDTSKILEAMERKFSSASAPRISSSNCMGLGSIGSLIGSALSRASPISHVMPSITSAAAMGALNRSIMSHANSNNSDLSPPEKKFKPTPEEFTRILPKIKGIVSPQSLMSPVPGLMTPITLAATVMKNAAHPPSISLPYLSALENNNSRSPNSDTNLNAKEKKKDSSQTDTDKDLLSSDDKNTFVEGYISGDTPHPVYLVSSVGGFGLNSSGNSTPSHEVKIEEEDPLEENTFSDDHGSLGPNDTMDDHTMDYPSTSIDENLDINNENDNKNFFRMPDEGNEIDLKIEPLTTFTSKEKVLTTSLKYYTEIPLEVLNKHNVNCENLNITKTPSLDVNITRTPSYTKLEVGEETDYSCKVEEFDEDINLEISTCTSKMLSELHNGNESDENDEYGNQSIDVESELLHPETESETEIVENKSTDDYDEKDSLLQQLLKTRLIRTDEIELLKSVMSKMEASGEELQRNPEFLSCLLQEVKIKLVQERLVKERPIEMIGLKDHTYMVPRSKKRSLLAQVPWHECRQCKRRFPPHRRHRYISHLRVHSGERPFKCSICGRGFNRQDHVTVHMRLHTGEKPFSCKDCGVRFTHKASLSGHKCNKKKLTS